ncbi:MAG TPA: Asp-tRNA(Asn)/Glu-tRNA(Gln) amidotransferase subunit GatB [Candidatus Saccharimonadales bacterium]|nr:Asp-tRNA(Asn)/Glu-tRNA(Gln) amidotransferase subunit GatB [Candidatus Saccharimonadales bacterium]
MALSDQVLKLYKPTIGVECHVQLKTETKLFSAVGNDARQAPPNTLISHIDVGMPGAMPVLNRAALELAARAAFALNTAPQKFSKFDRKHYFYPDLPKGYQITQYEDPIIKGGYVEFTADGQDCRVEITRVHLEEDAGKNVHLAGADYSLVDLNRAGTPLLEIVSEPQIHSAAQAKAYARELYLLMKYAGVSDVDLYHGNMRFDINVSVSKEEGKLGNRAEIKNLNSFRSVENAVRYEINRQVELLEKGGEIVQETRGWDEAKQKTTSQRGKEEAHDYRYMPEPDIPPIELDDEFINKAKTTMPVLPPQIREILNKLSIFPKVTEDILDNRLVCQAVLNQISEGDEPGARRLVFWLQAASLDEGGGDKVIIEPRKVTLLSNMAENGQLNSNAAQEVFNEMLKSDREPNEIAEEKNLLQVSDEGEIEKIVSEVLQQNPQAAQDLKNGEIKAIGFLIGQVMAKSQGKANPQLAQQLIKKQLGL